MCLFQIRSTPCAWLWKSGQHFGSGSGGVGNLANAVGGFKTWGYMNGVFMGSSMFFVFLQCFCHGHFLVGGDWNHGFFSLSIYWEESSQLTFIFFWGVETTNQHYLWDLLWECRIGNWKNSCRLVPVLLVRFFEIRFWSILYYVYMYIYTVKLGFYEIFIVFDPVPYAVWWLRTTWCRALPRHRRGSISESFGRRDAACFKVTRTRSILDE